MNKPNPSINPEIIVDIVFRRRWLIIIPLILTMIAGIYLAVTLPKTYQTKTLILVQSQRVPSDFVRSVVSADIDERISTISQQIMSRTNLEKIIEEFGLFSGAQYEGMFLEDKVESLRRRITVDVTRSNRHDADSFSISFRGTNPDEVMQVTNALAAYFIDENLKVREAQAIGTSDFLQDELDEAARRLFELEEKLKTYRTQHMGALPEQLDTNLRVLERLQEELNAKQLRLRDARQLQLSLEQQMAEENALLQTVRDAIGPRSTAPVETDADRLARMRSELSDLQSRYTDRHPDIIRMKKQIQELEANRSQNDTAAAPSESRQDATGGGAHRAVTEASRSLARQLADTRREIELLEYEIPKIEQKIQTYQERVELTPKIEQELLSLQRDYQNITASYNSLLDRKLEAEIAVNMEKKQKGEQFRIIDPAKLPAKPIAPDMRMILALSVFAGLGIGAGLIFLLEYIDTSFRSPEQIESELGLKVVAMVPVLESPKDRWFKRINLGLTAMSLLAALGLFAVLASITLLGEEQTKEFIQTFTSI